MVKGKEICTSLSKTLDVYFFVTNYISISLQMGTSVIYDPGGGSIEMGWARTMGISPRSSMLEAEIEVK